MDEIKDLKDSSYNRIVGGTRASKGAYPWFTLTLVETYDGSLYYAGCGAMLVAPEYVPLSGNTPVVFIVASCRCPNNCGEPSEILVVEKTIPHPDFEGDIHNDFALLKLNTRASTSPVRMYIHFNLNVFDSFLLSFQNLDFFHDKISNPLNHYTFSK